MAFSSVKAANFSSCCATWQRMPMKLAASETRNRKRTDQATEAAESLHCSPAPEKARCGRTCIYGKKLLGSVTRQLNKNDSPFRRGLLNRDGTGVILNNFTGNSQTQPRPVRFS